jgi:two-component system, NarL family, response regulator
METSLRVLIADDHPLVRQGIRRTLEASGDICVVGEARTGTELLAMIERRCPQVVLLDLRMPELDGFECLAAIRRSWPEIRTVVVSAFEERASIDAALAAGANAYLVKSANPADIADTLRRVWAGQPAVLAPVAPAAGNGRARCGLTPRETAILQAVARGLTTRAISRQLWLSEHTVKFHLTNIYRKLGVSNRTGAVRYAVENELVPLPARAEATA